MRRPLIGVRRENAAQYLSITIVAFAVTVVAIRVYLDTAGYPRVGGGGLHVAHMLWGGLLLVAAAVLIQLYVGRRTLILSALAAGIGVGLFIDEVGKFITESNDYFFAPAAPIIYGAILLLVLLWFVIRRDRVPSPAEATHGAIDAVRDLADGQLTVARRDRAVEQLAAAGIADTDPELPGELLTLLRSTRTESRLAPPGWFERGAHVAWLRRIMPERLERLLIRIGLLLNAISALIGLAFVAVLASGVDMTQLRETTGPIEFPEDPVWLMLTGVVWILVGVASAVALGMSVLRRHGRAMALAQYALLFTLIAGGLLETYVSQIGALTSVLVQLFLLLLVLDQRSRLAESPNGGDATSPAS